MRSGTSETRLQCLGKTPEQPTLGAGSAVAGDHDQIGTAAFRVRHKLAHFLSDRGDGLGKDAEGLKARNGARGPAPIDHRLSVTLYFGPRSLFNGPERGRYVDRLDPGRFRPDPVPEAPDGRPEDRRIRSERVNSPKNLFLFHLLLSSGLNEPHSKQLRGQPLSVLHPCF
jgi:hypothetical protein